MLKILHLFIERRLIVFLSIFLLFIPFNIISSEGKDGKANHSLDINATSVGLNFSTFFGGNNTDEGYSIAVALDGCCYVTGTTSSDNFPTKNAYNSTFGGGGSDAFVAKFYTNGSLLWSTYLGGGSLNDYARGIAVDTNGNCYVTGWTDSPNFPTLNAYNSTFGGGYGDAFVTKFSATGSLLWSTFLGGNDTDQGYSISTSNDGICYVLGQTKSKNFPTLNAYNNTLSGNYDVFLAKFSSSGILLLSTYLGGNNEDYGRDITLAIDDSYYITGFTKSNNFPTLNAYQDTFGGSYDVFVTKFSNNGNLLWSTFLGGNTEDYGVSIAVSSDNSCFITGNTLGNFPTLNAYNSTFGGGTGDAFIAKFSSTGSLIMSTYLGGIGSDFGYAIEVTNDNCYFVAGYTWSNNFPTKNAYNSTYGGYADVFISKFSASNSLMWSTFIGGNHDERCRSIAYGSDNSIYLTGYTSSSNFPTLNAFNSTFGGNDMYDVFITKLNDLTTHRISGYEFLAFIVVLPIIVIAFQRKRN